MLKNKTKIITIILVVLLVLLSNSFVFADNELDQNQILSTTNTQDNTKASDVYLINNTITIDYAINGNLYAMADTVTISSNIQGNAFIMAKNIIIEKEGYIYSSLYSMAESIEINGKVLDVYALCNNLKVNGNIYRDLRIGCDTLSITGAVGRDVYADCENIKFTNESDKKGFIYGDLNYSSSSELTIPEKVAGGNVNFTLMKEQEPTKNIADYIFSLGTFLTSLLLVWLVCLWLAPKFLNNTNQFVGKKTWSVLGAGLLTPLIAIAAFIVLILLQLTAKIAFVVAGITLLALAISNSIFTITANKFICTKLKIDKNIGIFGMLIITGFIIWAIMQIPYVGPCVAFISTVIGLGILVLSILPKKNNNNKVEPVMEVSEDK